MSGRMEWVFRDGCGCPFGVLSGTEASTISGAWKQFYETARERDAAMDRGVTAELMPFEQYEAEVVPLLRDPQCTHGAAA